MDKEEVKNDLKEIQFYYANQRDVQSNLRGNNYSETLDKIYKYNEAMKNAPLQLYDFYVFIYINNNSQVTYGVDRNISNKTAYRLNCNLIKFLCANL